MFDKLTTLLEIQQKHIVILSLKEKELELINKLSGREEALKRGKKELESKKEELKKMKVARHEQELELDSRLGKIKKLEVQLFSLKTNEEYQALMKEIELFKNECTAAEDEILNLMERIEEAQHEIAELEKSVVESEAEIRSAREALAQDEAGIVAEVQRLEGEKKIIASSMNPLLIEKYEKIMSHYGNRAVVPIVDDICQGCFINLPRHTVDEIRSSSKPFFCQNCSRILYLDAK